jgi:hypothetical protein
VVNLHIEYFGNEVWIVDGAYSSFILPNTIKLADRSIYISNGH